MSIKLNAQSGGSVALAAPTQTTSSADLTFKLPVADGSADQVIKTDGSGNLSFAEAGAVLQVKHQYLTSNTGISKSGAFSELNTDLRIAFTPKKANSNLILEFYACFISVNSNELSYAKFYDVTNSTVPSLPPANGNRDRVHWSNRKNAYDNHDLDACNFKIITAANNTTARTYIVYWRTEGKTDTFFTGGSNVAALTVMPMVFTITEIAA